MGKIINGRKQVIIGAALLFLTMLIFYAVVHPIYPFDGDDVQYLSNFSSLPIPYPRLWNPTRMLHQYLHPLTGYFAAYVIYPLSGDYLLSTSIAIAIVMAVLITALYVVLYRLFISLYDNKNVCALLGIFSIALCFALFKSKPLNNVYLFHSRSYTCYLAYTAPNILNTIAVCELMRMFIRRKTLSFSLSSLRSALMLVLIYFCIFSIQFSLLILLAFAVSFLAYQFFTSAGRKEKFLPRLRQYGNDVFKYHHIAIIIILGTIISMMFETTGGRARWDDGNTFLGSVFSIEFLKRIYESAKYLVTNIRFFNLLILALLILLLVVSVILYAKNRKKETAASTVLAAKLCLFSGACFAIFNSVLTAKVSPFLNRVSFSVDNSFGLYMYVILFFSLAALYIIQKWRLFYLVFPLVTLSVLLIAADSKWPYADSFYSNPNGSIYGMTIPKADAMKSYVMQIVEADARGETSVSLTVPKYSDGGNWPLTLGWADGLSKTLYRHRVTSKIMEITLIFDENMPLL